MAGEMVDARGPNGDDSERLSARLASSLGRAAPKSPTQALRPELIPPPPPPQRSRTARHPLVVILNFGVTAVLAATLIVGGTILAAKYQFDQKGGFDGAHALTVKPGASADDVADLVQREGLGNRWVFLAGVRLTGAGVKLQAGEYLIPAHSSLNDILKEMTEGRVIVHAITLPEGFTSQQVVDCLSADAAFVNGYTGGLTARQIDNCRNDSAALAGTLAQVPAEGSLLPETYPYSRGDTRQSVIDRMVRDRSRLVADIWARRAPDLPLKSADELVTLASIIEKETALADERSRVAAVYVNRLRLNMPLQADPTVIYALFKGAKPAGYAPSKTDLQFKSDYNTYVVGGLPPGPIANPGRASLEAAANPSRTRDLYFVADGTGSHVFAETYDDHQRNVARYRVTTADTAQAASPPPTPASAAPTPAAVTTPAPASAAPSQPRPAAAPPAPQPRPTGTPNKP
jgi:UPF0755 protein